MSAGAGTAASAEACAAGAEGTARAVAVARAGAERAVAVERRADGAAFVADFFAGALAAGSDGSAVVAAGSGAKGSGVVAAGTESITGSGTLACCARAGVDERAMTAAIAVRAVRDLKFFCVMQAATRLSRKRIRVSDEAALAADGWSSRIEEG